jgi:hypothetical protein
MNVQHGVLLRFLCHAFREVNHGNALHCRPRFSLLCWSGRVVHLDFLGVE